MYGTRLSPSTANPELVDRDAAPGETNSAWLKRHAQTEGLVLLGGTSLSHFRVRVAQCHLRRDLLPSFWSLAGILHDGKIHTVTFDGIGTAEGVVADNGVQARPLADFDDPVAFPNIAVLQFASSRAQLLEHIDVVKQTRAMVDIPSLLLRWLGFVWSAARATNPLLEGQGLPCAAFVESVYGLSRTDLTPGLASSASCPEAIWQAAKWWRQYYEDATGEGLDDPEDTATPKGIFAVRQPAAAARG